MGTYVFNKFSESGFATDYAFGGADYVVAIGQETGIVSG